MYNFKKTRLIVSCQQTGELSILSTVNSIDLSAFTSCTRITSIVAMGNKSFIVLNNMLYNNKKTRIIVSAQQSDKLSIPKSIINIDEGAFNNCRKITSININSNPNFYLDLSSSKQGILYTSNKQYLIYCPSEITGNITILKSVIYIYIGAFINCIKLKNIKINLSNLNRYQIK